MVASPLPSALAVPLKTLCSTRRKQPRSQVIHMLLGHVLFASLLAALLCYQPVPTGSAADCAEIPLLCAAAGLLQVGLVAVLIAAVVFIGQLSGPIIDNTVKSFPSPSAYEAYEESK